MRNSSRQERSLLGCCVAQVEQFDVSIDGFLETLANLSDTVSNILPGGDDLPRPGQLAAKEGLKAHHPVIIIPGVPSV